MTTHQSGGQCSAAVRLGLGLIGSRIFSLCVVQGKVIIVLKFYLFFIFI